MGFFGKSFDEKVEEALETVRASCGVADLKATVDGKVVTLHGSAPTLEVKTRVMQEFLELVEPENTFNMLRLPAPEPEAPTQPIAEAGEAAPAAVAVEAAPVETAPTGEQVYEVVSGDTLGGIAKRFYGKASLYPKIFEANRDILDDPNKIKVGQKLRIPPQES